MCKSLTTEHYEFRTSVTPTAAPMNASCQPGETVQVRLGSILDSIHAIETTSEPTIGPQCKFMELVNVVMEKSMRMVSGNANQQNSTVFTQLVLFRTLAVLSV